jgi:hypothetical protein
VREVVQRLDDLVAVPRLLRDEREDHELQVLGGELAAAAEALPIAFKVVGKAAGKAAVAAAPMMAAMAAAGEAVGQPGHEARELVVGTMFVLVSVMMTHRYLIFLCF